MKYPIIALIIFSTVFGSFIPSFGQKDIRKADKQLELKAFDLAIKNYEAFLDINPENIHAQLQLADAYRQTNELLKAITWYEKSIKVGVTEGHHVLNYANSLKKLGLYEKAKKAYTDYAKYDESLANQYLEGCDKAISLLKEDQMYDLVAFDGNSKESDFGATVFQDNVIFSSFRSDLKRSSEKQNSSYIKNIGNQLYSAPRSETIDESKLNFLRPDFKEIYGLGPVSYSEDGKKIAYTKNNLFNGAISVNSQETDLSVYIADVESNGDFSNERPLVYNQVEYSYAFPHLSFNGGALYFSSNRPGGHGGFDLYVSYFKDGQWTKPENLGTEVNSAQNEITPFLKNDILYFSSDQVNGLGGYDVYQSDISSGKWSAPTNMGKGINSPGDDYYLTIDEDSNLYVTSNRLGGKGKDDIYIATKTVVESEILAENVPEALDLDELVAQKTEMISADPIDIDGAINEVSKSEEVAQMTRTSDKEDFFEKNEEFKLYDHFELELTGAVKAGNKSSIDPSTERFFIQIASLSKSQGDVDDFSNIKSLGNLYRFIQSRSTKIRLGSFDSRMDADEVLRKVQRQGYKDAFITSARLSEANYELLNEGAFVNYYTNEEDVSGPQYKVRLASYSDSSWFDADELQYLDGDLEQWTKGYWHIFILSGFANLDEAESAKIKAVNRGFKEAEVVIDDKGVLKRLNQH